MSQPPQVNRCVRNDNIGCPRKSICVENRIAFVAGLCVGRGWVGYPDKGIPPWRDTGVELQSPAVADVAQAFARAIRGRDGV
jgi:phosphatidylserine/phosphatidylglycerophosphate/cardiolipin synthase-like enzyme